MVFKLMIAHRGASGYAPENTMVAFKLAKEHGLTAIELDTHETKDGVVVCIHDRTVNRTTNGLGLVRFIEWDQLSRLDASYKNKFGLKYQGERIPRIEEVLEWAKTNNMFILWDLKVGDPRRVIEKIKTFKMEEQVWVHSLIWGYMDRIKELAPGIRTGLIGYINWERCISRREQQSHDFIAWKFDSITLDKVKTSQGERFDLGGYTVNKLTDMQQLINLGVTFIIGDYSERMKRIADENNIDLIRPIKTNKNQ